MQRSSGITGTRALRPRAWRSGLAGLVALALAVTACGSSSKPSTAGGSGAGSSSTTAALSGASTSGDSIGVTSSTITIGEIADVSGPVPGLFQGAQYGIQAWAAYVNAHGGVDGRKINLVLKDSALSCTTYTTDISSIVNSVFAAVGSYAIFDGCGAAVLKAHPDFPNIQGSIVTPSLYALPNTYVPVPLPAGGLTTTYQYIKDKFPADLTHTAGLYGAAATASYEEESGAAKSIGFRYVYSRGLGNTETNFTADILRMKADGVKIVDMQVADAIEVADFLQEAQQQNFHPDAVVSAVSYDPGFFTDLGSANASSLVIGLQVALYLDANSPVANVRNLNRYLTLVHPGAKPTLYAVEAFASGLMFQQAMADAGPNPSRSKLVAALSKLTSFDAGGMVGPGDPGAKAPAVCEVIAGVSNGAFVRIDPPSSGFECNGTFVPYTASS